MVVIAFAAFILIAVTIQYTVAFIRISAIVARVEQSSTGNLPLELSEFHGQRLNWLLKIQDPNFCHHHGMDLGTPGVSFLRLSVFLMRRIRK
jgi:hypothetical protein